MLTQRGGWSKGGNSDERIAWNLSSDRTAVSCRPEKFLLVSLVMGG
ncbi:MAG TPA: hypothetical protein VJJ02_01970 [Candidatus Paceibacterota bacterium]